LKILIFILSITIILGGPINDDCEEIRVFLKEKYNNISDCYYLGYPGRLNRIAINNDGSFTKEDFKKIFSYDTLEKLTIILENNKNVIDPYTLYPSEISQLENVKELNIINENGTTEISKQFAFSNTLDYLNLVNITFKIPLDFPNALNKLSLSNVKFEKPLEFPNTLEELSLKNITFTMPLNLPNSLKKVYISNFNYDFSYIASLTKLESLDFNFQSDIPSNDKMSSLKNLTNVTSVSFAYSEKKITEIPEFIYSLKNIEKLDFSYQAVREIPENLCTLTHLEELKFCDNKLEGTLPKCLNDISSLSYVDFSGNSELKGNALNDNGDWCDYSYTHVKFDPNMQCIRNVRNNSSLVYSEYEINSFVFTGLILLAIIIGLIVVIVIIIIYYRKMKIKEKNNPKEKFNAGKKALLILLLIILFIIVIFLIMALFLFILLKSMGIGYHD